MKALVVYDSTSGNTEKIATAIAAGIGGGTRAIRVGSADVKDYEGLDLLVLGSPVQGGRPTESMQKYIKSIPQAVAKKLRVATFDTRMSMAFAKIFGYASVRMANQLQGEGCILKSTPQGFIVKGRSGPLADGELERATMWGEELAKPQ
jgi:flavodoxin I